MDAYEWIEDTHHKLQSMAAIDPDFAERYQELLSSMITMLEDEGWFVDDGDMGDVDMDEEEEM